jgi:transposase
MATHAELPTDLDTAHEKIRQLVATLNLQEHLIQKLQHQLEQLLRQRYGKKGERIDPAQLLLFAQEILAQAQAVPTPAAAPEPVPAPTPSASQKNGHGRKPLPASLPRKPILHDVPPEQRVCPDCGIERTCIGREVREQLEYVPASMIVLEHIRPKYACRVCEGNIVIADRLPEPIEKGLPGPGLMAHVVVSKYADHQPLYRQERIFKRFGVDLSRSTMCDWMAVAAELLGPIVKRMMSRILTSKVVQNDDTTVPVQDHAGKGIKKGRLWASVGDHDNHYVVYCYSPDHSGTWPQEIFQDFKGYLQADAASVYDHLYQSKQIIEVGCMMHARRKFYEARTSDPERSHQALAWIKLLYDIEGEAKKKRDSIDYEAFVALRHKLRGERSLPIFDKLRAWLEVELPKVLPKSPIGEAIQYALNHWSALKRPLEAGFLELDNGACERAFKPVALGRKNWLFAGSDKGGQTAAVLMSLCMTCKELEINPEAYLRDVLDRISTHPASRIDELLPDRWKTLREASAAARD